MDRPGLPPRSPALGASASSSMSQRGYTKEHFFSEVDMETINKDNRLKDLVKTDPKRVKKILRNREYAAQLKDMLDNLRTENHEVQIKLKGLNEQAKFETSSYDQSMGSSVAGSWVAMLALANKFDMMSIGGRNSSAGAKMPQNYRILRNREYTAQLKVQKVNHIQDLQRGADALKM
ncbi:bZIP transcription factor 29-like [Miscanthus floridulus]|uniref:bZIP transcription factor 29-like n=1 Tax=Miscanthus floridulus TaxID=154761 RepID=UPI00345A5641